MLTNMQFNYEGRVFRSVSNSANGEVNDDTRFHFRQEGDIVWGTYGGGSIRFGTLIATTNPNGALDMRYQHINAAGELMTGQCHSIPEILPDGRYRLREKWQWTCGDRSSDESVVEEVRG